MAIRRFSKLSPEDQLLRNRLLMSENKKLRTLVAKLEVANISLTNENRTLKKDIESRANGKLNEMIGQIMKQVEHDSEPNAS